jgi:capsular polysaccharide biosynthesis protein
MGMLQTIDIDTELNKSVTAYLNTKPTYQALRELCLDVHGMKLILDPIAQNLKRAVEADKHHAEQRLREEAGRAQMEEDLAEAVADRALTEACSARKRHLDTTIRFELDAEANNARELNALDQQLIRLNRELSTLPPGPHEVQQHHPEADKTVHGHDDGQHQASHSRVSLHPEMGKTHHGHDDRQQAVDPIKLNQILQEKRNRIQKNIDELTTRLRRVQLAQLACKSRIETLRADETKVIKQESELRIRERFRSLRGNSLIGSSEGLTPTHLVKLQNAIKRSHAEMDTLCSKKLDESIQKGHLAFLNTLENTVKSNLPRVDDGQYNALMRIIAQMRLHIIDLDELKQATSRLGVSQSNLNRQLELRTHELSSYSSLQNEISKMAQQSSFLEKVNSRLRDEKIGLLATRNRMAKIALLVTVASATCLGYLLTLVWATAATPVIVPVIACVVGAAIVGLILTSGIAWIRSVMKQSEMNSNRNTIAANAQKSLEDSKTIARIIESKLPEVNAAIVSFEREVALGREQLNLAQITANQSHAKASIIDAAKGNAVSVTMGGVNFFNTTGPAGAVHNSLQYGA